MKRLLVLAILCTASLARAQTSSLPDGSTLNFIRLYLHYQNSVGLQQVVHTPNDLWSYFNYAHCECSRPNASMDPSFTETNFGYLIQLMGVTNASELQPLVGQVWVGSMCNDTTDLTIRATNCHQITSATIPSIGGTQTTNGTTPTINVFDLMEPESSDEPGCGATSYCPKDVCDQRVLAANEWVAVDTMMSGTLDYWVNQEIATDSQAPPTPTNFTVNGSQNGISISWTAPLGDVQDIAYYQALCTTDLGDPPFTNPSPAKYVTPRILCGFGQDTAHPLVPCNFTDTSDCVAAATGSTATPDAGIDASDDLAVAHLVPAGGSDAAIDAPPDAPSDDIDAAIDASNIDAGPEINLAPIGELPPAYICGEIDNSAPSATSMQITGLINGVNYTVVLLAIDKYGNAAGVYFNKPIMPKPVTDFWQDLHDNGGHVEGGFCLISETYGDDNPLTNTLRRFRDHTLADTVLGRALTAAYYATLAKLGAIVHGHWTLRILSGILLAPLVVFALLWHFLTLPGLILLGGLLALRRRIVRSRLAARALAAGVLGLIFLGAPARAHAQSPYWENQATGTTDESAGFAEEIPPVKWKFAVGVGPYTPDIDAQSATRNSAGQGPYQAMFGGYEIMPKVDVDRFLWTGYGQLGVGISLAYMGKSANAYVIPSDPSDPNRPRSPGDTTSFRLIPLQVTAIYRYTVLDDNYGIPIVPYARGGLGYYVWWSTIDGSLANESCSTESASCSMVSGKAIGASAGFVGTVGLAFRAERIDAAAARSMRDSGIQHAGFFAEINAGWIDGFGKATKLDVGDTTWFAGAEFEF